MHFKKILSSGLCLVMAATLFPSTTFAANTPANQPEYVLMNIPYSDFYQAELNNDISVDAFTSATLNKTRTASLVAGSYHVDPEGSDITGITYPVKIGEGVDLSSCKEVTENDSVTITVTNRGQTSTNTYSGKDALFENESYAYYVLDEAPSYYKEAIDMDGDGKLEFTSVQGTQVQPASVSTVSLTTKTSYGDYELDLTNPDFNTDTVYAVVLSTREGNDYGLRHMENIWRGTALSWSTGFTEAVHNCPTSSEHYKAMMGQHINKITYYTKDGIYAITVDDLYVPIKFSGTVTAANSTSGTGSTTISFTDLPEDYVPSYAVDDLTITANGTTLSYKDASPGQYTLTVSDQAGKYADLTGTFILSTSELPAAYDNSALSLATAKGFSDMDFIQYLTNITSVSVNNTVYAASGRNAVTIINDEDGSINLNAKSGETSIFGSDGSYTISVSATGYPELNFTLVKTSKPTETTTQKPAETTTQKPATTTTQKPATTTTQKPATTTTQKPATTQTIKLITKTYGQKSFSVKKAGTTTYTSSNKNIISVSKTGTATIKGVGKVVLTVQNKKNGKITTTKTTYLVKPGTIASKSLKAVNLASKKIKVSWTKRAGLGLTAGKVRYQIQYSTSKKFTKSTTKTITVKGNTTTRTITKLKKNKTYYIRMRGYDQTNKKAGTWSSVKKVTVKK